MKNRNIFIKLIKILGVGNIYSKKELSKLTKIKKRKIKKYISKLKDFGIKIKIVSNKKYKIRKKIDFLNYRKIYKLVKKKIIIKTITQSTNQYLIDSIRNLKSGDVCLAEYQKKGRGTYGKNWYSPFGYNLYLSMYWRFSKGISNILSISLITGIVIAETINKLTNSNILIKWPNDLILNKKKIGGILIESINKKNINHTIIGIGINIKKNFINQKKNTSTNLEENGFFIEKNILSGNIILALQNELKNFDKHGLDFFFKRWHKLNKILDKK